MPKQAPAMKKRAVRGSKTGRPIMALLDLLGRRWTLRIMWELREGPLGFRALQQHCDNMSSSVLRQRLTEMLAAHLVVQQPDKAYALTELGDGVYAPDGSGKLHKGSPVRASNALNKRSGVPPANRMSPPVTRSGDQSSDLKLCCQTRLPVFRSQACSSPR